MDQEINPIKLICNTSKKYLNLLKKSYGFIKFLIIFIFGNAFSKYFLVKNVCTEGDGAKACEDLSARCVSLPNRKTGYDCKCEDGYDKDSSEGGRCIRK